MANATQVITLPGGITFAGFYYPEILRDLLLFLRNNRTRIGLTDENEYEAHVQMLRSFALVGHVSNTRLDMIATELFIDSAKLRESVRKLLALMGIVMRSANPATADLLLKLSEVTTADKVGFIPALSEFATDTFPPITYESSSTAQDLDRSDQVKYVYAAEESATATNGSHNTAQPDILTRAAGVWAVGDVGKMIEIQGTALNIGGTFRISEFISATQIRLIRIPDSTTPAFQTEATLVWRMLVFSVDHAVAANTAGVFFSPWAAATENDYLYVGNRQVQPAQLNLTFNTIGNQYRGTWEYFDDRRSLYTPSSVVDNGADLTFNINSMVGVLDHRLKRVAITYLKTGETQWATSSWDGADNVVDSYSLFGQIVPSVVGSDYAITSDWVPFPSQEDNTRVGSFDMRQDQSITWDIPQTRDYEWLPTDVNLIEAYWIRYRLVSVIAVATMPSIDLVRIDQGDQYILSPVTQGETIGPQIIGSSSGLASQAFTIPDSPFIDDSELIEVDEVGVGTWTTYIKTDTFLTSESTSRHYTVVVDKQNRGVIHFGDGIRGKIPPLGSNNVRSTHRKGGDEDGNVGQDQITANADGVSGIATVTNPRPALGWRIQDGGDALDLERIKRDGPAQTQTRGTASTMADIERLATTEFIDSFGDYSVKRAWAVEEKFGIKTIGLLVVGEGGAQLSSVQLADLATYFNGDRSTVPPTEGVLIANHQVTGVALEPRLITIVATVVWPGGNSDRVESQLLSYVDPLALEDDGSTYLWNFGGVIALSKIHDLIHNVDPAVSEVRSLTINGAAASLTLLANELPVSTAASITITVVQV